MHLTSKAGGVIAEAYVFLIRTNDPHTTAGTDINGWKSAAKTGAGIEPKRYRNVGRRSGGRLEHTAANGVIRCTTCRKMVSRSSFEFETHDRHRSAIAAERIDDVHWNDREIECKVQFCTLSGTPPDLGAAIMAIHLSGPAEAIARTCFDTKERRQFSRFDVLGKRCRNRSSDEHHQERYCLDRAIESYHIHSTDFNTVMLLAVFVLEREIPRSGNRR